MKGKEYWRWQILSNVVMTILTLLAVVPFVLLIIASFTENNWATVNGFSFLPGKWSLEAYTYISASWSTIGRGYLMTILVAAVGTCMSLAVTSTFAYALAKQDLPFGKLLNFILVFSMLFNGGIVASYYTWNNVFHVRDTVWALILPNLMMGAFNVILVKNYYMFSVPASLVEAARIDGAGEMKIFATIVVPLSKPILATIGLMTALAYWNDWTNGLYYLTLRNGSKYYTIQLILNQMNENIQYLATNASKLGVTVGSLPSTTVRMAIAVVGILPILIIYPSLQKYFVKGITMGAVKE